MRHNLETAAQLEPAVRDGQIRRIDMTINEAQQYIRANAAQIELDEQNRGVEQAVEAKQQKQVEIDEKLATLVEEFNRLVDEQRYAEAELVAKKARAMDADNPVVVQLTHTSKVQHRLAIQKDIYERKGESFIEAIDDVVEASIAQSENFTFGESAELGRHDQVAARSLRRPAIRGRPSANARSSPRSSRLCY